MHPNNAAIFAAMTAVIEKDPSLCQRFKTDLTTHDRRFLEEAPSTATFLWFPYEWGTHIVKFGDSRNPAAPLVETIYSGFRGVRAFEVENGKLREVRRERATAIAQEADRRLRRGDSYSQNWRRTA